MNASNLLIAPKILKALQMNQPVVALESTIISHGMPYPKNLETAIEVEELVAASGAVPATIAIVAGKIIVGLSNEELGVIASSTGVEKCSRRDLPFVVSQGKHAATTVATTMIIAHAAGIKVFATGGIGGVHRGVEVHGDVSADLMELKQTPVAVVSAGIKSILDIPRTLEMLESYGVPVCTYQNESFPAFFTRESGVASPRKVSGMKELSEVVKCHFELNLQTGLLIGNPIAKEYELNPAVANQTIAKAIELAKEEGITGKDITPFLLSEVNKGSGGKSLESNVHLIKANASLAAALAIALTEDL